MGGQSFKCPLCSYWFLAKSSLRKHIKGKHSIYDLVAHLTEIQDGQHPRPDRDPREPKDQGS